MFPNRLIGKESKLKRSFIIVHFLVKYNLKKFTKKIQQKFNRIMKVYMKFMFLFVYFAICTYLYFFPLEEQKSFLPNK